MRKSNEIESQLKKMPSKRAVFMISLLAGLFLGIAIWIAFVL